MKCTKLILSFAIAILFQTFGFSQNFMEPTQGFSVKKTAYLTLTDGSKLEGKFKGGKTALNGGYKWITFKPEDGKRMKIQAEEIESMLIPESTLSKIGSATDFLNDATQWDKDVEINKDAVKEGYSYFETVVVAKKKKDIIAVRQLLNPGYAANIKVMSNEMDMKGPSLGIAGMKVAGGGNNSYYIKVGDGKAVKVKSGKYDDLFSELYGSCPSFMEKYGADIKWKDVEKHVFDYSQMCAN